MGMGVQGYVWLDFSNRPMAGFGQLEKGGISKEIHQHTWMDDAVKGFLSH